MRFIWPIADHYITRGFDFVSDIYVKGDNGVRMHAAVDLVRLQGGTLGRDILAVADGIVVGDAWDQYSGYYIVLEHAGGWRSTYRHLVSDAPPVVGHPIMQGQVIGQVGSTGLSSGPHLHLDLWHSQPQDSTAHAKVGWWAHDPELYLGKEDDMTQDEFNKMYQKAIDEVGVRSKDSDGKATSAYHPMAWWTDLFRLHYENQSKNKHGSHYSFQQIADNLPELNQHLTNIVNALIETQVKGQNHYSFQQITDNIRGLNSRLIKEVNALIAATGGEAFEHDHLLSGKTGPVS